MFGRPNNQNPGTLPVRRWFFIITLFLLEAWLATYQLRFGRMEGQPDWLWVRLAEHVPAFVQVLLVTLGAAAVFAWRGYCEVISRHANTLSSRGLAWPFLITHVVIFSAYLGLTHWLLSGATTSLLWIPAWIFLGLSSISLLGLALLPSEIWRALARRGWAALAAGLGIGVVALAAQNLTLSDWEDADSWLAPLREGTFWLVRMLLSLVASEVISNPEEAVIGTSEFQVIIGPPCSGFEGIGLIWALLAGYFFICRQSLRFPHALVLIPVGTVLIWLTNALRITALILIGAHWSPEVAERGFHSQAGWLAFNAVGLGLVAVSSRWRFFRRDVLELEHEERVNPAAPYLVPFVALMGALMVCTALSAGFDYLYPARVLVVTAALAWYWPVYSKWSWSCSWMSVGLGVVVFGIWMGLETWHADAADTAGVTTFGEALTSMAPNMAALWLTIRVIGSVVTVPIAEELAFRGFLIRRLQGHDFDKIPTTQMTWLAFLVSSVLFGLLHDRWLAGTLAGMIYAAALYRRGRLADAVWAHAITNGLIAVYVLATSSWALWS